MADQPGTINLTDALVELSFLLQAKLAHLAGEYDLSLTQVRLLGILRDREPGIVELAATLGLDKSSVSGLVDRAQRRGLVERASSKSTDGRAIRVVLTKHGRRMVSQFGKQDSEEIAGLVAATARCAIFGVQGDRGDRPPDGHPATGFRGRRPRSIRCRQPRAAGL